jgi:hypothetical protein
MTDAELRALLLDCLRLWEVRGTVAVRDDDIAIESDRGVFTISRAEGALRPLRWFYQTPERAAAGRRPRASPSVVALLSALRNAMEGAGGDRARIT